jgi:Mannose-6-phosphate isomerase
VRFERRDHGLHALDVDETYVITAGEGWMELGGVGFSVRAGDAVAIPAGTAQRIRNTGAGELVFLCLCVPRFRPDGYTPLEGDAP